MGVLRITLFHLGIACAVASATMRFIIPKLEVPEYIKIIANKICTFVFAGSGMCVAFAAL